MSSSQKSGSDLSGVVAPKAGPDTPDKATSRAPCFTNGDGAGQVFHFHGLGINYGTDDKGHAAALILSVLCLVTILLLATLYALSPASGLADPIKALSTAFVFIAGIAIGKSAGR